MKILFIVESDFLEDHVGVRRVITHYVKQLGEAGHTIAIAAIQDGGLVAGELTVNTSSQTQALSHTPYWSSSSAEKIQVRTQAAVGAPLSVKWSHQAVNTDHFDLCFITTPWLCAKGLPPIKNSIGIVYDLVPNLLALECLRFPSHMEIYKFAHEHNIGFKYYIDHCQQVLCISESTRNDLLRLCPDAARIPHLFVDVPFPKARRTSHAQTSDGSILLVNALDWRKNFKGIERMLTKVADQGKGLSITVIGRERMPLKYAMHFLRSLEAKGMAVNWFRDAEESLLQHMYHSSDMLLFPSLYEGLGLPILEAQASGLPVISSSNSSCKEVNMNPSLTFDTSDEAGMVNALMSLTQRATNQAPWLRGTALTDAQIAYLSTASQGIVRPQAMSLLN